MQNVTGATVVAPTYQSSATTGAGDGSSTLTFNLPASIAAGDRLVAVMSVDINSAVTLTPTAGWAAQPGTPVSVGTDGQQCFCYVKAATGSEGATDAFTITGTNNSRFGTIVSRYSGCTGLDATSIENTASGAVGSPQNCVANSITTVTANSRLVYVLCMDNNVTQTVSFTAPSGMTLRSSTAGGANASNCAMCDGVQASAGASGTKTGVATYSGTAGYCTWLIALKGT